ncbi:MAG: hypothetical protein COX80_01745 [Candidatus Magasanikbacteria bacterium CG_4_10_14_0_2_um_filter_33_14]|uniref:Uncharacterized protein n=1 Tax=Candidatus Magasanikbacteria bacterium CG_4_10_14_0_2_um_filter_33_14 TaxID=1974636 RepID=A0A2M7VB93_9BACT|nr:MAG: hypothetical protein COX80_01745 [Candidatus Magasanikbacteria bacterium CG_4_10_14_0_2_um_filter_33_14]
MSKDNQDDGASYTIDFETEGDEGRVVAFVKSPKCRNKAEVLREFYPLIEQSVITLEDFVSFASKVRASSLSDEGLAPKLDIYHSKSEGGISTWAGAEFFNSFEMLKATLHRMVEHSIITSEESSDAEKQARIEATQMYEQQTSEDDED